MSFRCTYLGTPVCFNWAETCLDGIRFSCSLPSRPLLHLRDLAWACADPAPAESHIAILVAASEKQKESAAGPFLPILRRKESSRNRSSSLKNLLAQLCATSCITLIYNEKIWIEYTREGKCVLCSAFTPQVRLAAFRGPILFHFILPFAGLISLFTSFVN